MPAGSMTWPSASMILNPSRMTGSPSAQRNEAPVRRWRTGAHRPGLLIEPEVDHLHGGPTAPDGAEAAGVADVRLRRGPARAGVVHGGNVVHLLSQQGLDVLDHLSAL